MKFKALFILFNIVFASIFITVFFLPLNLLDAGGWGGFWGRHWGLLALFSLIVVAVNVVFALWWRLLGLLEAQDWAGLANYLEKKVYNRTFITASTVRLFLEASFLIGDFDGILKLSDYLGSVSPAKQARFSHKIAAALIVGRKTADARDLCQATAEHRSADRDWNRFFLAFSSTMLGEPFPRAIIGDLSETARDPIVVALCGYLSSKQERDAAVALSARARIREKYDRKKWDALIRDSGTGIHVIVLSSLIGETGAWLFRESETR